MANERQELHCHACQRYVQFDVDTELDGNHVLECPNCGHEHCRVVKAGRITSDRWDTRNGPTINVSSTTTTITMVSTYSSYITGGTTASASTSSFLYASWLQTT